MTPDTKAITQSQSLFRLEAELVELMQLREEMEEAGEDTTACDMQLVEYTKRELRKVDNVRAYLAHCEMMAEAAKAERDRLNGLAVRWSDRRERLKDICKATMEYFGLKRLEGQTGSIALRGNGGLAPLVITDASLIPEGFVQYEGKISGEAWMALRDMAANYELGRKEWKSWFLREDVDMRRIPDNARIREALKGGPVAGCRLDDRGQHLEVR